MCCMFPDFQLKQFIYFQNHINLIVGGQGSKVVSWGHKSNSEERNYTERTCLTGKEFGMMLLMKISMIPT